MKNQRKLVLFGDPLEKMDTDISQRKNFGDTIHTRAV